MILDTAGILILLSALVVFSYLFDLVSKKTNVPSVLLLLGLGIGLNYIWKFFGGGPIDFSTILPVLGSVGLILIVFEGSLELQYEAGKSVLIRNAFLSSLIILVFTALAVAGIFSYFTDFDFHICLLHAIPFSVISSAVAIPSVKGLVKSKREFIIFESTFSDIIGIMFFNFVLINREMTGLSALVLSRDLLLVVVLALVFCILLMFLMGKMKNHVKFFLIISTLILIYGVGKVFHLSSLLIVMLFGIFLANYHILAEWIEKKSRYIHLFRKLEYPNFNSDLSQLHTLSSESAFLIRTFFFLVFGFSLHIEDLFQFESLFYGSIIVTIIYISRYVYLKIASPQNTWPEVLVSPRGLISILLFLSIPSDSILFANEKGILVFVVLVTCLIMTIGLITGKSASQR
ncbi:MAG: cation:proton antiporter [Flavobacteriales bacterium]|nr:cation:proton antiporter [Flavobacteriales bacterium]